MQATANGPTGPTDWQFVDWRAANRQVRNLRQRIFRASQQGDRRKVRSLQTLMLRSYANRLVSVRRVTQVNQGKRTAGIDRVVVKTPKARGQLVDDVRLYQPWKAHPTRRVYIPKGNGKRRPLGIPTIRDRVLQAMVKNALEPSWEARFEGSSYGFRPGRSGHDAMEKVYMLARPNKRKKWVVEADIEGAFDHIDHDFLLEAVGPVPGSALIRQWLKVGCVDQAVFHATEAGTPQGGIISPLLANIALHGMEQALGVTHNAKGEITSRRAVVRYADDFVVFAESREDAERIVAELEAWLADRGLRLSHEKTRIVHLTDGFDFLGFTVRHYPAPRTSRSGYKLLITPSKASVTAIKQKLRDHWLQLRGSNTIGVLKALNPIIRGQANYYRVGVASHTFKVLDDWLFRRQVRWIRYRHPHKSWAWAKRRYWGQLHPQRADTWVFGDKATGGYLLKFSWFPIKRHVLVRGRASPDDVTLGAYWKARQTKQAEELPPRKRGVARTQGYACAGCGESLFNGEELHLHHVVPRSRGGGEEASNLQLRHLYCHQQAHRSRVGDAS